MRRLAHALALCICIGLGGCGDNGKVVDPSKVPGALERTGFRIVFRKGPVPGGWDSALYGTATNARGVRINFGFFFSPNAQRVYDLEELRKFVPESTNVGSTAGESYAIVTSAEYGNVRATRQETRQGKEEFKMAGTLEFKVAALAPKAFREEGP